MLLSILDGLCIVSCQETMVYVMMNMRICFPFILELRSMETVLIFLIQHYVTELICRLNDMLIYVYTNGVSSVKGKFLLSNGIHYVCSKCFLRF